MKTALFNKIGLVTALCLLSACGTIDEVFGTNYDGGGIRVTNTDSQAPAPNGTISGLPPASARAPGQPYNGNFDPNNLMSVYNQVTRGGVQMYDPAQSNDMAMISSVSGGYSGGVPAPQDSRVTVFPVDGGYLADIQQGTSAMGVNPYSSGMPASAHGGVPAPSYSPGNAQIFFKHGSARLGGGDQQVLEQVAEQAKFSPVDRISIEGHASTRAGTGDPIMDRVVNLKQSMDRTYAVSRNLMLKGVPAEKIKATSWGDTRQPPGASEEQARRVDIYTGGGY